jgi:hypothetical protein
MNKEQVQVCMGFQPELLIIHVNLLSMTDALKK